MPEGKDLAKDSFVRDTGSLTSPRLNLVISCIVVSAVDLWIDAGPADHIFIQATAVYSRPLVTEQQQAGRRLQQVALRHDVA